MVFSGEITSHAGSVSKVPLEGTVTRLNVENVADVALSVPDSRIAQYDREGEDLVITLTNGDTIVLEGYFDDSDGEDNPRLEVIDAESGQYVAVHIPEDPAQGAVVPLVMPAGAMTIAGLGALGLAAAAGIAIAGSGGDDPSSDGGRDDQDTTPPEPPSALSDHTNPNGTVTVTGKAEPGARIEVTWPDGTRTQSKADANGKFEITSPRPQTEGEIAATATDASGNTSDPATLDYDGTPSRDETPPEAPSALADHFNPDGTVTLTGKAEPGARVEVTWPDGSKSRVTADADGNFSATSETPQTFGDIEATATDASGNTSDPASLSHDPAERRVNSHTESDQTLPSVATLDDGGWIVTWQSWEQDGSDWGVYQQRFDKDGNPVGPETQVNIFTEKQQANPSVTSLSDGGWVVTWHSMGQDGSATGIFQQRYDANGDPVGAETQVNTTTQSYQNAPSTTALADGGWVVTWHTLDQDGSSWEIYQQRYDKDGNPVGPESQVNTYTSGHQWSASTTALDDGGWLVTWQSKNQDGSDWGIYQQRFDKDGNPVGSEVRVNTHTDGDQWNASVSSLDDGGWIVVWMSDGQDGSESGIYQQRFDKNGNPVGSEVRVNTQMAGDQRHPDVTDLSDGGWVVTWHSYDQDGSGADVYQQRFDKDGNPVGSEVRVNTYTDGNQSFTSVTALDDGGWIVIWHSENQDGSGWGIYGQRFDKEGNRVRDAAADPMKVSGLRSLSNDDLASLFGDPDQNSDIEWTPPHPYDPANPAQLWPDLPPEVIT